MTAVSWCKKIFGTALEAAFPLECLACGAEGTHACAACLSSVPMRVFAPRDPAPLASCDAAYAYANPLVRGLLHDLKYHGYLAAQPGIEALVRRWAAGRGAILAGCDALVPVPLYAYRRLERGFNQAELIAAALGTALGLSARADTVVRLRPTDRQVDVGDRRAENVLGAFAGRRAALQGLRIGLIDDVWTSGATMKECAAAALRAGAREVRGFALAWGRGHKENAGV